MKLRIKKTVEPDSTKTASPAPSTVSDGGYKIEDAGYRGSRLKIRQSRKKNLKQSNPGGYSGVLSE